MKFALFLGVVAILAISGDALKCYQCTNCADPFTKNETLLKDCGVDTHCAKGVITFQNNTQRYGRACVSATSMENPIKPNQLNFSLYDSASLYFCNTDGCNGSGSISAVISIIFTTLVASLFASF
ncbi:U-scoloptoxin(05)-Sm1a-like [Chelonus insularis]|uniref:U-scoloptoxin(05)-Sm1a-like n=1 Tax=Chelonus insularis TaxID=460826 RepID=UPI001589D87A|nr:U-scoloptoxin(05)-Sm1a-like [Chelonus insularis]